MLAGELLRHGHLLLNRTANPQQRTAQQTMVNTGQIMAEFGLTEADIASAARTSMPGEKPTALLESLARPND